MNQLHNFTDKQAKRSKQFKTIAFREELDERGLLRALGGLAVPTLPAPPARPTHNEEQPGSEMASWA